MILTLSHLASLVVLQDILLFSSDHQSLKINRHLKAYSNQLYFFFHHKFYYFGLISKSLLSSLGRLTAIKVKDVLSS